MTVIKQTTNDKCWQGYGEKGTFMHSVLGFTARLCLSISYPLNMSFSHFPNNVEVTQLVFRVFSEETGPYVAI